MGVLAVPRSDLPPADPDAVAPRSLNQRLVATLGAVLVVQLVYWFVVYPLIFASGPRPPAIGIANAAVAAVDEPTLEALAAATFLPVELPHTQSNGPGYRALRFTIDLPEVPERGLDLIPQVTNDNLMIVLNGSILRQEGRMERPDLTFHGNNRSITFVPAGLLRKGTNEFVIVAVRQIIPYFDFNRPLIGESEFLRPALAKRAWLLSGYQEQTIAIGIVVSVMAFVLLLRATQREYALWLFLLVFTWTMRSAIIRMADPPGSAELRLAVYFVMTAFLPVAWANVANLWTGKPWRWVMPVTVAAGCLAAGFCVHALLFRDDVGAFDDCSVLANMLGIAVGAIALFRFLWHLVRTVDDRYFEMALFVQILSLMVIEFFYQWRFEVSTGHVQNSLPFLLIAFAAAFLSRNVRLFRSVNEINAMLKDRLAAREAELAAQHARQEELLRRETLVDERRRLMGEMHDGVGGQLVSLMHANRHRALTHDELDEALTGVTDELRLVIDSLDTVGSSVSTALANYRRRIEPRLKSAGIELTWQNSLDDDIAGFGPREVLHVCRIVQEAVTNALKHAHPSRIELSLGRTGTSGDLEIIVRDNGRGFDVESAGGNGHGQRSMRERAVALNGTISIDSAAEGTVIVLRVPGGVANPVRT